MSQAFRASVKIWGTATEKAAQSVALEAGLYFLGFGFVGAFLVWIGAKMAKEIIITKVEGNVNM